MSIELMLNAVNLSFVAFAGALASVGRTGFRVLRDGRRRRGSRRRAGHHHRRIPHPADAQRRPRELAETMTRRISISGSSRCCRWLAPPSTACFGKTSSRQAVTVVALFFSGAAFAWALGVAFRFSSLERSLSVNTSHTGSAAGNFSRRLRLPPRPALAGHAAGRHRRRLPHPRLLRRLHGARRRLLPLLRLPQPLHVLHADAGPRRQLPADVRRLGRRGPRLVPADRLLLH